MEYNIITNIENCYYGISHLIYYSHIPTGIIALLMGFLVFWKNRTLLGGVLFGISVVFSLWLLSNLIVWISPDSRIVMFTWSLFGILNPLLFVLCLYFVYVFVNRADVSFRFKAILLLLILPLVLFHQKLVNGFDVANCESTESGIYLYYFYGFELLISSWIFLYVFYGYFREKTEYRKQILYLAIGIGFFLLSFFTTGFLASYLTEQGYQYAFEIEQYGLFGMTFFMGVLAYMIVKFKAFNIKLIGAQALVVTLIILIGSQFAFIQNPTNKILNGITLALSLVFGWFLVKSVKKEVERKEELQRLSDKLAAANERLRQLDMEKSEFISIASHQLRTPLTAIKGYVSLVLEGAYGEVSAAVQDVMEKVYSVNSRLVHLVEDLLNVSRIEAGRIQYNFEPTQLEPLIAELVDMFTPTAKSKELTLTMQLPKVSLAKLTVDPNKIKEVVSNLIDNSLKYTKTGGTTVTLEKADNKARITVSDTGIGIKAEDLDKLFEKFVRTKETTKMVASGTGLGLFVGRNFIEAHGGKIWAESEGADKGSRFIIELPLVNPNIKVGTSEQAGISTRDLGSTTKPPETV